MNKTTFAAIAESIQGRYSRFTWSPVKQAFADTKPVPVESIRVQVDMQIAKAGNRLGKAADELIAAKGAAGWDTAVDKWAATFREEIKALEIQSSAMGHGGLHSLSPGGYERAEKTLSEKFGFHDTIIETLKSDPDYVDSGRFAAHADGYARTARFSYETERGESHQSAGFLWEASWHHAITSCSQCEALDGVWVPIGTNPEPGERICGPGCDCTQEFSMENPDE